ncbi:hypothetical protein D3C87_2021800 [compost metagenome]
MRGEALGQGNERLVAHFGQIHFGSLGELRVRRRSQEDIVGKQWDLLAIRVVDALVQ